MAYATRPCRQMNSSAIRGAALCHIPPAFDGRCSIVNVKAVWRVKGGSRAIDEAWRRICAKRLECDEAVSQVRGVAFFYSAISTFESRNTSANNDKDEMGSSEDEDEGSPTPSQLLAGSGGKKKKLHPAVSYWIAIQSANGAHVSPRAIHSALTTCEVEIFPQRSCKSSDKDVASLCQMLKDHKNKFVGDLVESSYNCYYATTIQEISDCARVENYLVDKCPVETDRVVHLHVVDSEFSTALSLATGEMVKAGLQLHQFGIATKECSTMPTTYKPLAGPITVLCNDIETLMKAMGYRCYRGNIVRKIAESTGTFTFRGTMKSFLHKCASNDSLKDRMVRHMSKLIPILSDPDCELLPTIIINYDLIEVSNGWFWSFSKGTFLKNAISPDMIGNVSPRAFLEYDHERPQDPKYFREILENSLQEPQIAQFCSDFLRLFAMNKKQHKEKVPCLIGESGSGKTSLFFPVFAIVKPEAIAKVTKQKCFNKSLIGPDTQVIFLDEASEKTMDVDDWKLLTQGGFTAHDSKYAKSRGFVNKCPMIITCQREMRFEGEDRKAMDARLNKYYFKSLPSLDRNATRWLQRHAMDCIVWAHQKASAYQAARVGDLAERDSASEASSDETNFTEQEIAAIKRASVVAGAQTSPHGSPTDGEESPTGEADESPETIEEMIDGDSELLSFHGELSKRLDALDGKRNLKWQTLVAIQQNFEGFLRRAKEDERARAEVARKKRQQNLIDIGVDEELAERMPDDPADAYPATLQREVDRCAAEMSAASRGQRAIHAKRVFEGVWLQMKEHELVQLLKELAEIRHGLELDVWRAMEYRIDVASDALRLHHLSECTDPECGREARRNLYLQKGWIAEGQECLVTDLYAPPNLQQVHSGNEQRGLLTPPSSQPISQCRGKRSRKRKSAAQTPPSAGKRQSSMRDFFTQSQRH